MYPVSESTVDRGSRGGGMLAAMRSRNEELPLAAEIQETVERLLIYDALVRVFHDPTGLMDPLLRAEDLDDARSSLRDLFGLDEIQATAVIGHAVPARH